MIISKESDLTLAGSLLTDPTEEHETVQRCESLYENCSEKYSFEKIGRNFQRQYAHMYATRLWKVRPKLEVEAKKKWGDDIIITRLANLKTGQQCCVIGTLYKHMTLKPNILQEISEEYKLMPPEQLERFTSDTDKLVLEDEVQRIELVGKLDVHDVVTGVVVAVYGEEMPDCPGKFDVQDFCFVELCTPKVENPLTADKFVCIVSGLEMGGLGVNPMQADLLVDLLSGALGDPCLQHAMARVTRVIVAGNSLSADTQDKDALTKARYLTKRIEAGSVEAVKQLDDVLQQLASSVNVDLMAGPYDPGNYVLPQQPMHPCMFPLARRYATFRTVTNPYCCRLDGVTLLGTSGQPVRDMYRYSRTDSELELLGKSLRWGHLAPTAPDTLGCYPYYDDDPFVIDEAPGILFAGNCTKFEHEIYQTKNGYKTLLVTVPSFAQTGSCVIVNLRTFECQELKIDAEIH